MFQIKSGKFIYNTQEIPVPFDGKPIEFIEWKDLIILRYELEGKGYMPNNIIAFTRDGKLKWAIQALPKSDVLSVNLYSGMYLNKGDELIVHTYIGGEYYVDYETGKTINARPGTRLW